MFKKKITEDRVKGHFIWDQWRVCCIEIFGFLDFCILVRNVSRFRALGSPFQDGRKTPVLD